MRQLTALDAQFLNVESPTTVGHVGSLIVLDPSTAPGGVWNLDSVRAVFEPRLHLAAPLRQRLVEVPLGLGRPYWVDDPHFDIEFHLRELALPAPGTREQLGEQVARIHARQLDRSRPLWEAYVITGLEGGRAAFYSKIHHAAIDGVSGAEILETIMDLTVEPREVPPEDGAVRAAADAVDGQPGRSRRAADGAQPGRAAAHRAQVAAATSTGCRARRTSRATRLVSGTADPRRRGCSAARRGRSSTRASCKAPAHAVERHDHRAPSLRVRLAAPRATSSVVKNHFGMTVNDVVMALTAARAAPVAAGPRRAAGGAAGRRGAGLDPHRGPGRRARQPGLGDARRAADAPRATPRSGWRSCASRCWTRSAPSTPYPPRCCRTCPRWCPTALSGLAARALFKLATVPGVLFNLFVSNVPGPQLPLYIAGARVEGIYPVSAVTDMTGGLNITLFSYDGSLDFGLIACREMVPDVWNLIGYLQDAMAEMVALVPAPVRRVSANAHDTRVRRG